MMKRMEEYLIELIGHDAYEEFSKEIAKEAFRMEIDDMPEGEFKDFCNEQFDLVTSDDYDEIVNGGQI